MTIDRVALEQEAQARFDELRFAVQVSLPLAILGAQPADVERVSVRAADLHRQVMALLTRLGWPKVVIAFERESARLFFDT